MCNNHANSSKNFDGINPIRYADFSEPSKAFCKIINISERHEKNLYLAIRMFLALLLVMLNKEDFEHLRRFFDGLSRLRETLLKTSKSQMYNIPTISDNEGIEGQQRVGSHLNSYKKRHTLDKWIRFFFSRSFLVFSLSASMKKVRDRKREIDNE